MEPICGIPADTLREVARAYARAESAIIFWGMGVSQHTHGTDNARCLIALSLITGQVGRPGTGLHPLRGQNNVQGASDAGLIPMFFPDYKSVENPEIRAKYEKAWGVKLDRRSGQDRGRDHGRGPRRRDQGHRIHDLDHGLAALGIELLAPGLFILGDLLGILDRLVVGEERRNSPASEAPCRVVLATQRMQAHQAADLAADQRHAMRQRALSVPWVCWETPMPQKMMALSARA